jgi:hypothetical protein
MVDCQPPIAHTQISANRIEIFGEGEIDGELARRHDWCEAVEVCKAIAFLMCMRYDLADAEILLLLLLKIPRTHLPSPLFCMYQPQTPDRPDREPTPTATTIERRPAEVPLAAQPSSSIETVGASTTVKQQVRQLPRNNTVPNWLKSLLVVQRGSLIVFCSILVLSSIAYVCTVYTQSAWKTQHGQLKRLQKHERQQGVMTENLKNQMAIVAEQPDSGLVSPSPDRVIIVPKAPQRPAKSLALAPAPAPAPTYPSTLPLGY